MAKVILMNHWNAPGSRLFRKSVTKKGPPLDIPDELVPFLPSTAKIVPDDYVTPTKAKSADTFSEHRKMLDAHDLERAAMKEEGEVRAQAEVEVKKAAFQRQLDSEKPKKGKK